MQSLATDTEVNRFVDSSLILPDDFVLDRERPQVIFIKGVAMKQILVKVLRKICPLQQVNQLLKGAKGHSISLFKSILMTQLLDMRMP
jgi:hypothetical protein